MFKDEKQDEIMYPQYRYVDCYCPKHAKVMVGLKANGYLNILTIPILVFIVFLFLLSNIPILARISYATPFILIPILLSSFSYRNAKRTMLKAGHSAYCSKRIGYLAVIHAGVYSYLVIMKEKKEK